MDSQSTIEDEVLEIISLKEFEKRTIKMKTDLKKASKKILPETNTTKNEHTELR
jgi:hypothetical protein